MPKISLKTISDAGDQLETLRALRHKLAEAIDNTSSGRDIAALARQLQLLTAQIAEIEAKEPPKVDTIAEILAERSGAGVIRSGGRPLHYTSEDTAAEG